MSQSHIEKAMLVYQAGIANVFRVDDFGLTAIDADDGQYRTRVRLMQSDFRGCESFVRGMEVCGVEIRSCGCNRAGDIAFADWEVDRGPFRDKQNPINPIDAPILVSAADALRSVIDDYQSSILSIRKNHATLLAELVAEAEPYLGALEDFFDDFANDTKGSLGSSAANNCDDEATQDEAIGLCEAWIADNVSNAGIDERILCVLDGEGVAAGAERIRTKIAALSPAPGC